VESLICYDSGNQIGQRLRAGHAQTVAATTAQVDVVYHNSPNSPSRNLGLLFFYPAVGSICAEVQHRPNTYQENAPIAGRAEMETRGRLGIVGFTGNHLERVTRQYPVESECGSIRQTLAGDGPARAVSASCSPPSGYRRLTHAVHLNVEAA